MVMVGRCPPEAARFYPRDALLARSFLQQRGWLSVRHTPVLRLKG